MVMLRMVTKAGFEPEPDLSRLAISPVRLPFDFQRASRTAATAPRLLVTIPRMPKSPLGEPCGLASFFFHTRLHKPALLDGPLTHMPARVATHPAAAQRRRPHGAADLSFVAQPAEVVAPIHLQPCDLRAAVRPSFRHLDSFP